MFNKLVLICTLTFFMFVYSCAVSENIESNFSLEQKEYVVGEAIKINNDGQFDNLKLTLANGQVLKSYYVDNKKDYFVINRFLDNINASFNNTINEVIFEFYKNDKLVFIKPVTILPSILIKSMCHTTNCETLTGNVIQDVENKIDILSVNTSFNKIEYTITYKNKTIYSVIHEFNSMTDVDTFSFKMPLVDEKYMSYISTLNVTIYKDNVQVAETLLPFKVVRPIEVKYYGGYELAEVYEAIPVTGCIPGTIGNNVSYSESNNETRQNSATITISNAWSLSNSQNLSSTQSEGLNISETDSVLLSSTLSSSETTSESESVNNTTTDSRNINFTTSDGENWSWSNVNTTSEGSSTTNTSGTNSGVSGSSTIGASTEGSIPLLGKASGKVEISAGVSMNWSNSESNTTNNNTGTSRGYATTSSTQSGRSFGSMQTMTEGSSLTGSYAFNTSNSESISENNSISSGRVWNMSETVDSGRVITENDAEALSETIVNSSSSTTTFSYSGYIPRGKFGIFFRQTSRYTKLSEIITYDLNGFVMHAGYISMNNWSWAPELSIGNSCDEALRSNFNSGTCYIPPCGE